MPNTPHSSLNLSNIKALSFRLSARGLPRHFLSQWRSPTRARRRHTRLSIAACPLTLTRIVVAADPADFARRHVRVLRRRHHRVEMPAGARNHDARRRLAKQRRVDASTSAAIRRGTVPATPTAVTSALTPMPPVSKVHSASAIANPPSEQSCADSMQPSRISLTTRACSAASRFRSIAGALPGRPDCAWSRGIRCRQARQDYRPARRRRSRRVLNARVTVFDASSSRPTTPSTGVGKIARPSVSL